MKNAPPNRIAEAAIAAGIVATRGTAAPSAHAAVAAASGLPPRQCVSARLHSGGESMIARPSRPHMPEISPAPAPRSRIQAMMKVM